MLDLSLLHRLLILGLRFFYSLLKFSTLFSCLTSISFRDLFFFLWHNRVMTGHLTDYILCRYLSELLEERHKLNPFMSVLPNSCRLLNQGELRSLIEVTLEK